MMIRAFCYLLMFCLCLVLCIGPVRAQPNDIIAAVAKGNYALIVQILKADPKAALTVDAKDGASTLHWAAMQPNLVIGQVLIQNGAVVDALDGEGRTPLHWAAVSNQAPCVRLLLGQGADPRRPDKAGKTSRQYALERGHNDLAVLLEKAEVVGAVPPQRAPRLQDTGSFKIKSFHWLTNGYSVRWLSDGKRFLLQEGKQHEMCLIDPEGKITKRLGIFGGMEDSPDGKSVYLVDRKQGLFTFSKDTGAVQKISDRTCTSASASPAGKHLVAYLSGPNPGWGVLDLASGGFRSLPPELKKKPVWSPTGESLLCVTPTQLWVETREGKEVAKLSLAAGKTLTYASWEDNTHIWAQTETPGAQGQFPTREEIRFDLATEQMTPGAKPEAGKPWVMRKSASGKRQIVVNSYAAWATGRGWGLKSAEDENIVPLAGVGDDNTKVITIALPDDSFLYAVTGKQLMRAGAATPTEFTPVVLPGSNNVNNLRNVGEGFTLVTPGGGVATPNGRFLGVFDAGTSISNMTLSPTGEALTYEYPWWAGPDHGRGTAVLLLSPNAP